MPALSAALDRNTLVVSLCLRWGTFAKRAFKDQPLRLTAPALCRLAHRDGLDSAR